MYAPLGSSGVWGIGAGDSAAREGCGLSSALIAVVPSFARQIVRHNDNTKSQYISLISSPIQSAVGLYSQMNSGNSRLLRYRSILSQVMTSACGLGISVYFVGIVKNEFVIRALHPSTIISACCLFVVLGFDDVAWHSSEEDSLVPPRPASPASPASHPTLYKGASSDTTTNYILQIPLYTSQLYPIVQNMSTSTLIQAFKPISLIFAISTIITGAQSLINPLAFSTLFGIQVPKAQDTALLRSYISLIGSRQLSTGLIILLLAARGSYNAIAHILAVSGIVVAGWDGVVIRRHASTRLGLVHAGPGFVIAAVAAAVIWNGV